MGAVDGFLGGTADRSGEQAVSWHGGTTLDLAEVTGMMLGEFVLHGFDIATALGARGRSSPGTHCSSWAPTSLCWGW